MDTFLVKPTSEEVKEWNEDKLLRWIQLKQPGLLEGYNLEKFRTAFIRGRVFVKHAGNVDFFEKKCKLPIGISEELADLAKEIVGRQTTGKRRQSEAVSNQFFGSPELEASLITANHVFRRPKTVKKLAELVDNEWVVHVRGTPSTGKTTLAYLLREYYKERGDCVVLISCWRRPSNVSLNSFLAQHCERECYFGIQLSLFTEHDIVFILTESQKCYLDSDLWEFIKSKNEHHIGPKFCIFTASGSPSQGTLTWNEPIPLSLDAAQQVSNLRSHMEGSPDICLFYDNAEFEGVLTAYCEHRAHKLPLEKAAQTYLLSITNGHPGAVNSMLYYLSEIYGGQINFGIIELITKDHLIKALHDEAVVFSGLHKYPVDESFPKQSKLTLSAMKVLSKICRDGSVPFRYDDAGIRQCVENGWIYVDAANKMPSSLFCSLPSRLHEKYIEYVITAVNPKPFPNQEFPHLRKLCIAVFKCFSKKNLLLSSAERRPAIAAARPLEAKYQDEFYRAFTSLLGNGVGISSEWSRDNRGRFDFRILGPKWGVQLLRDGDQLKDHYDRFLPGGKYYSWIESGLISDWLVIDCRCSTPEEYTRLGPNLWHAVFAKDYSTLRILDADNQEIMSEVCLMG